MNRRSAGELVGRDREIQLFGEHRRAAGEGSGRVVLLGGEAGVGKSRLLRHFESSVGRSTVAATRCVEFVQAPLGPLRDVLEHLERRSNAAPDAATRSLVGQLAFERSAGTDSPASGALFESIDAALTRYAFRGTVTLSIEDLHWADRSTLAFLSYLAARVEKRRILVIATFRSNEIGTRHPMLSEFAALLSKPEVSTISLAPLSESATLTLVERSFLQYGKGSSRVIADIARRSQGNPFFAEELVKSSLESAGGLAVQLPLSIRASVLARAAGLSESEREVISMASVLGERFSIERLATLVSRGRETVLHALERGRALQLLADENPKPGQAAFRHGLTQEVLYGELLSERVRPLHEAIALELENRPARDEVSVELAHHWRRAGDLERASEYDEIAGDRAVEIGAFADAIVYYERALEPRKVSSGSLVHKIGAALGALNNLNAGIERLRQAAEIYRRSGDLEGFAKNASALGALLYNSGNAAAATRVYRHAIETLSAKLPQAALDLVRARVAYNCVAALDADGALAFLEDIVEPIADPMAATQAYMTRFKVAAMRGEVEQWRANAERALDAARRLSDVGYSRLRNTHAQIALDALGLGEIQLAREHFRAAMPERLKGDSSATLVSAASAFEYTLRGDFLTAQTLLHDASGAPEQSYAILVHVKSANLVLGICSGDDARLRSDGSEPFLRYGIDHGMKLAIGLLGGPYAWALGIRGERDEAAAWISQISDVLPGPHRFLFAYLAAAQFGRSDDVFAMRDQLTEAARRPQDRANKAVLGLFDAFAAQRDIIDASVRERALDAALKFEAIGWPWLAARSYELGGESRRALEDYRSLGSGRDVRRLEAEQSGAAGSVLSTLSSRELEVAELISKGHSNEEVSQILHISTRTAEKHVSSALRKLNLRSRLQLGQLLARSQTTVEPL